MGRIEIQSSPTLEGGVSKRFFSNTILNYVGQGFILALTFVTLPYTVHHLGADLFGVLALVQVTAGFAGLLNLGIGRALTKYVSELYWKRDFRLINHLFQTAWTTSLITGVVGLIILIAPRELIARAFFRGGPEVDAVTTFAIYIAAFGLFSSILLEVISAIPAALQRFDVCNAINVFVGIIRCLGPVIVLACGYSIREVLIVVLGSNLLAVLAFMAASRILIPGLSLLPRFNWAAFRQLFHFSLPLLSSALFSLIIARVDRFILAYYMPLAAVTFFTLPYTIAEKVYTGVANITVVVLPFTSELHSIGVHDKVHELYLQSTKIMTLVTLPFTMILLALPGPILQFWIGPEYAEQGAVVLMLLAAGTFLNAVSGVATATSLGVGRAWIPAAFAFATSVLSLISNVALIPFYGIVGAAWAFLLPQLLSAPLFVSVVTRMLNFSLFNLLQRGFLPPLICGSVQFAVLFFFRQYVNSLLTLVMLCFGSLGLYVVLSFFLVITRHERSVLFRMISWRAEPSASPETRV
jgi:O-antigen/teichoic acid export membrane protein